MKIGFIGLGNMAKAMIGGMIAKKMVTGADVIGSAKTEATILAMRERYGIETTLDNGRVAMDSDVLFLAVKPQFFGEVLPGIKEFIKKDALIVSIAAGKSIADIEAILEKIKRLCAVCPILRRLWGKAAQEPAAMIM